MAFQQQCESVETILNTQTAVSQEDHEPEVDLDDGTIDTIEEDSVVDGDSNQVEEEVTDGPLTMIREELVEGTSVSLAAQPVKVLGQLPPKFKCIYCSRKFFILAALKMHTVEMHQLKCDKCPKIFYNLAIYQRHQKEHFALKPVAAVDNQLVYSCDFCIRKFFSPLLLKKHRATHLPCPLCSGKQFETSEALRIHIKSDHSALVLPPLETDLHDYDWSTSLKMLEHSIPKLDAVTNRRPRLAPYGPPPHVCPVCPQKYFSTVTLLRAHINIEHKDLFQKLPALLEPRV